uniref:TDP43_N domain-containing protein n=1 Tax=Caenorhabditis tropicalis TaxID=1561998 RepID=A0A1I7TTZ1_9PELO
MSSTTVAVEKYVFRFEINSMDEDGYWSTQQVCEIDLENYQSIVIQSLHAHLKKVQKDLDEEKKGQEEARRDMEERTSELFEIEEINRINYEKSINLKAELKKAEDEMKKLEEKLEDSQEIIAQLTMETEEAEEQEEKSVEEILSSYGPAWSNGDQQMEQRPPRFSNPLVVFGYQPPCQPLPEPAQEHPLSAGNGKTYCYIRTGRNGPEAFYKKVNGVYKIHEMGYKMRPVNFYSEPTGIKCQK